MATEMERFTAWLSVAERNKLRTAAAEHGTSENYVLRMILRAHFGMGVPRSAARNTAERERQV